MWSSVILVITSLDILKGTTTGYYDKGILIEDRIAIWNNYKNHALPYDVLCVISVMLNRAYFPDLNYKVAFVINLLIFFKFYIIVDIINKIDTTFQI